MKFILVTGGVLRTVGKGTIASSLGAILKSCEISITAIKIDTYLNVDAAMLSSYEHGEIYVLDDGGEVDLDVGNYERFLDVSLTRDHSLTTGKIFKRVMERERRGDYLGKTVEIVPHVTDAIENWIVETSQKCVTNDGKIPQVCIIELGGTIDDIENVVFLKAFESLRFKLKDDFCCVHVTPIPTSSTTGEQKTKPTQLSMGKLRSSGLSPDLLICRSSKKIDENLREKLSQQCKVALNQVLFVSDLPSIFKVPLVLVEQGVVDYFDEKFGLNVKRPLPLNFMIRWRGLAEKIENLSLSVNIAIVGKYPKLSGSYASVIKALQHASLQLGYQLNLFLIESEDLDIQSKTIYPEKYRLAWQELECCTGVIISSGFHGKPDIDGKQEACKWCRENNVAFLGISHGFHAAVVEFARNVLQLKNADSREFNRDAEVGVIIEMPELNQSSTYDYDLSQCSNAVEETGMRLGRRATVFVRDDSTIKKLYGDRKIIHERHRHLYEVNPRFISALESSGLKFVGKDEEEVRIDVMELKNHQYYVGTSFHPEFLSRPLKPSPVFLGLILASVGNLRNYNRYI